MKKKLACLAMASLMLLSLTGCGSYNEDYYKSNSELISSYVVSDTTPTICYDNYQSVNLTQSYLSESDKSYTLELAEGVTVGSVTAINSDSESVDVSTVATVSGNTFTAVGKGTVKVQLNQGNKSVGTLEIVCGPAYPDDPDNAYTKTADDYGTTKSDYMGWCHDPSLIEVEEDGQKVWYIFSTGWERGNEIRRSTDLIHWEYVGKSMTLDTEMSEIDQWLNRTNGSTSWWAPDIVPAPDGGYWLYTCVVDGSDDGITQTINGETSKYSMACIVLFHSESLKAGSFEYVDVLVQSCIPSSGADTDVNAIDPQIIYTPEGRMYMAYGSFGTGNYILELDPETGLRKDKVHVLTDVATGERSKKTYSGWLTPTEVRAERELAVNLFGSYTNEDGDKIGWSTEYYGIGISRKNMEAPVIARHDNVVTYNDNGEAITDPTTYYYSMHSMDALDVGYAMWGGKSQNVEGTYYGVRGDIVVNQTNKTGNKYMGSFTWADNDYSYDTLLTGHNDLFTTSNGVHLAAYITRTDSYTDWGVASGRVFLSQVHQYTLNAKGDICINPNRYAGEIERSITADEMLAFADQGYFKLCVLGTAGTKTVTSEYVQLNADGTITGAYTGTWKVYGKNFIKITLDGLAANNKVATYYGTVTASWLDDQYCVGMSFTALGQNTGLSIFANSVVDLSTTSLIQA